MMEFCIFAGFLIFALTGWALSKLFETPAGKDAANKAAEAGIGWLSSKLGKN